MSCRSSTSDAKTSSFSVVAETYVLGACIDAKRHVLLRLARSDGQLDRERRPSRYDGLACLQHVSRLCRRTRH